MSAVAADGSDATRRDIGIPISLRHPSAVDSGVPATAVLPATFRVYDRAQRDVMIGRSPPRGPLPFAFPATWESVLDPHADAPGHAETRDGALHRFGSGRGC